MSSLTFELTAMDRFHEHLEHYFQQEKALSARALARNAKISHVYMLKLLKGESVPTLDVAERVATATGSSLVRILQSA